jgi:hypothetical protein
MMSELAHFLKLSPTLPRKERAFFSLEWPGTLQKCRTCHIQVDIMGEEGAKHREGIDLQTDSWNSNNLPPPQVLVGMTKAVWALTAQAYEIWVNVASFHPLALPVCLNYRPPGACGEKESQAKTKPF